MSLTTLEREVKLRFDSPDEARAAILAAGATPLLGRRLQEDSLLDTEDEGINAADLGYDPSHRTVYVPTFFKNTVAAYWLK